LGLRLVKVAPHNKDTLTNSRTPSLFERGGDGKLDAKSQKSKKTEVRAAGRRDVVNLRTENRENGGDHTDRKKPAAGKDGNMRHVGSKKI